MKLDLEWVEQVQVNLSAVQRRTTTLTKRRSVKKENQAAWLLKAITLIDLTTLSGDDTYGKVDQLCEKAVNPLSLELQNLLQLNDPVSRAGEWYCDQDDLHFQLILYQACWLPRQQ